GPDFGVFFVLGAVALSGIYFFHIPMHGSVEGDHQMAMIMQVQNNPDGSPRYTLSFIPPEGQVQPNQDVTLRFRVYNADTGQQVTDFDTVYEKLVHLVIVDNALQYFDHIHPVLQNGEFVVTTKFPKSDLYHLYLNFQPSGGLEQQVGVSLKVGNKAPATATQTPDTQLT